MATATESDPIKFHKDMVAHKLIIDVGVPGIFGRGAVFEDVLSRVNDLISRIAKDDGAEKMVFPPAISRHIFEKTGFLDSFPNLAGTVFSFFGQDAQHKELSAKLAAGQPWGDTQGITECVLNPAACYPLYPTMTGTLPENGRLVEMQNWVFRHEPSPEPTRMQAFRVREFVRAGTPEMVVDWRNMWLERGYDMLVALGLPAKKEVAADPFFGRGGRMLAANQKEQQLKFEVVIPVISEAKPTACCSFNYHQDKFGKTFDIKTSKGEVAQTACLGFGMERICMALFKTHGFVPSEWPKNVREKLWV